jgi:hypothetical protein
MEDLLAALFRLNSFSLGFLLFNKLAFCIDSVKHCHVGIFWIEYVLLVHDFKILLDTGDIALTLVDDNFTGNLLLTTTFVSFPLQPF